MTVNVGFTEKSGCHLFFPLLLLLLTSDALADGQGTFSYTLPCKRPHIENGYLLERYKMEFAINELASIECDPYYRSLGKTRLRCLGNGTWAENPPYCVEIRCSMLPELQNGKFSPTNTSVTPGQHVNVSCFDNYILKGTGRLVCTGDGSWDPFVMPVCAENGKTEEPGMLEISCCEEVRSLVVVVLVIVAVILIVLVMQLTLYWKTTAGCNIEPPQRLRFGPSSSPSINQPSHPPSNSQPSLRISQYSSPSRISQPSFPSRISQPSSPSRISQPGDDPTLLPAPAADDQTITVLPESPAAENDQISNGSPVQAAEEEEQTNTVPAVPLAAVNYQTSNALLPEEEYGCSDGDVKKETVM